MSPRGNRLLGLAACCAVSALAGCFEAGPLLSSGTLGPGPDTASDSGGGAETSGAGDSGAADAEIADDTDGAPSTGDDTGPVADTSVAGDTATGDTMGELADSAGSGDDTGPVDGAIAGEVDATEDTDAADGGPVQACLTDQDCAGVEGHDRCAGPLRCVDYGCRPDPAGAVVCPPDEACLAYACNPASGVCEGRDTCSCETPLVLACGATRSWSASDPGGRDTYAAFGCGPAPAGATMRLVSLAPSGRVRVTGGAGVAGMHVLEGPCDPVASCAAGGGRTLYFDALPGASYTLAVEERGDGEPVSVQAACGLTAESACRDGLDDDGDGVSDCDDRDCDGIDGCMLPPLDESGLCRDAVDNDGDGATDCDDPDCVDEVACLETCEVLTTSTYCNFNQGLTNGGGKARSTHYSCNPVPQTAKEVVFEITAGYSGPIRIGFQGASGLALHLLVDTGRGCTPRDCAQMSTGDITFFMSEGTTYYLAVDGPGAVVGNFNFEIDCLEQ